MQGKIGLEEHFAIAETLDDSKIFLPDGLWPELSSRLLPVSDHAENQCVNSAKRFAAFTPHQLFQIPSKRRRSAAQPT